ncbi:hypothetical protein MuYL_3251 [Mucilaginibacter xinganensis]|uniref:Uncharacterized protein n=1 Tax=Mucilaginibacter xinganensis TaxID=1234841 RepID=A0A223NZ85_9SPHI|nr:hypothetical protein MuYL_3251 [Mucilaginibacter xinganensis]
MAINKYDKNNTNEIKVNRINLTPFGKVNTVVMISINPIPNKASLSLFPPTKNPLMAQTWKNKPKISKFVRIFAFLATDFIFKLFSNIYLI